MAASDSNTRRRRQYEMTKEHKDLLRKNHVFLIENLELTHDFYGILFEDKILTADHEERIEAEKTTKDKIRHFLLQILPKRGPHAFESFIKAMVKSGQEFIAKELAPDLAEKYIEEPMEVHPPPYEPMNLPPGGAMAENIPQIPGEHGDHREHADSDTVTYYLGGPPEMLITIAELDTTDSKLQSLVENEENYKMTTNPRGRAIIINITKYHNDVCSERRGSDFDATNMENLLKKLMYQTEVWTNQSSTELKDAVEKEAQNNVHKDVDSFIMVILSHGKPGKITAADGLDVRVKKIIQQFQGEKCPLLIGKPKVFLIQACRGNDKTLGCEVPDSEAHEREETDNDKEKVTLHPESDTLIAYATVSGYESYRLPSKGTWFVRVLVKVFMDDVHKDHILDMMTKVNGVVAKLKTKLHFVQQPEIQTTLRKKFYFFPGHQD